MLACLRDSSTCGLSSYECCDCCSPSTLTLPQYKHLAVLNPGPVPRKKRRRVVRTVDSDILRGLLTKARDDFVDKKPEFYMVEVGFVCSDEVIEKLCKEAKYLSSVGDIPSEFFCLCSELKETFYSIISSCCTLIENRRQRR